MWQAKRPREFRGYIGWQTSNFDNDFVSVTCPGPDLEFEWQLGSKVDVPNSSFIRVTIRVICSVVVLSVLLCVDLVCMLCRRVVVPCMFYEIV